MKPRLDINQLLAQFIIDNTNRGYEIDMARYYAIKETLLVMESYINELYDNKEKK